MSTLLRAVTEEAKELTTMSRRKVASVPIPPVEQRGRQRGRTTGGAGPTGAGERSESVGIVDSAESHGRTSAA